MVKDDIQLIRRVLSGDDEAFTALVRKYQKSVHALAWKRVGDFHFAEEITQDAFLRAYRGLPKLKDPGQFSGWLYVITNRLCNTWLQKNKEALTLLEDTPVVEVQRSAYERYMSEQYEKKGHAHREELVRELLAKLPESERTVITLHYLGEMTAKEIGNFLGVSVNTITSRLQRARKRLQQHEELLVQEMLGSVQLSDTLTESIARKVADVKLTPSPTGKPFLPWLAFGGAAVLITLLLLGASNQYLVRFQKPYSFQAQSEPTIEIIDTPITLNIDSKPAVRNQTGRINIPSETSGIGLQASKEFLVPNTQENSMRSSTSRWTQTSGPGSGSVFNVFATSGGTVYAFSQIGSYKLPVNATAWVPVAVDVPTGTLRVPMTEHEGVLYLVSNDVVFASTDEGATWNAFCGRPAGNAIEFVITGRAQAGLTMYLALWDKGVFRSTDAGEHWVLLNGGLMGRTISTIAALDDTVFAGTDKGLYRLDSGVSEWSIVDVSGSIYSLVAAEDNLYVGTGPDFLTLQQVGSKPAKIEQMIYNNNSSLSRIFRSADLGASWTEITPTDGSRPIIGPLGISLLVVGKMILAQADILFRSRDGGQTWVNLGFGTYSRILSTFPSVAVNENTFYKTGPSGIHRTTDGGESWHLFMDGMVGMGIQDLVAVDNGLYAHTEEGIVQLPNGGESWRDVHINDSRVNPKPVKEDHSRLNYSTESRLTIAGNILYVVSPKKDGLHFFRLATDGDTLIPVQGIPYFEMDVWSVESSVDSEAANQVHSYERSEKVDDLYVSFRREHERIGAFVVSGKTFYVEYKRKLFKWKIGDSNWKDTGLMDTSEQPDGDLRRGFKLAVSGKTVYVGKRDGNLFQSLDEGISWKDVTPTLPIRFTHFKEIIFVGSTAYVATDTGVMASQNGEHWRVLTDGTGRRIVVDRLAVKGTTVYGAGDAGVYRLDARGHWEPISPNVPGKVISLVINNNRLYIATQQRGMFHISLAEEGYSLSRK